MRDVRFLLAHPEDGYQGTRSSYWFLVAMTALTTARSLIHMFAPDGGADSIAGLAVEGTAGDNLVHLFGQWGLEQLLLAGVAWVFIARYQFLIPFALLLQLMDWIGRSIVGTVKPLVIDETPPGGIGNVIFPPMIVVALWFALPRLADRGRRARAETEGQ
ncbi:MAG: hypothetical protein OER95_13270 [Acidimicrobiia bacterium]|nr:hypothetical protein [Acidimicrobiia bacterium]